MKHPLVKLDASPAGEIDLPEDIFGVEPRPDILFRVVQWQDNRSHTGTTATLRRGQVNRTTKKMYKQKGTGQARHGAQSAPQFRGGGKAMAPVLRSRETSLPKKVRQLGLKMALSAKKRDGQLIVIENAEPREPKTKWMAAALAKHGVRSVLLVDGPVLNETFARASRNLRDVGLLNVAGLNVRDLLKRTHLIVTQSALAAIEERLK